MKKVEHKEHFECRGDGVTFFREFSNFTVVCFFGSRQHELNTIIELL